MPEEKVTIIVEGKDSLTPATRQGAQSLGTLEKAAHAARSALTGLGQIGLAGLGIQQLAAAARSLGQSLGIDLASSMEGVEAQLNAFTKDATQSRQILAQIRLEADKTPFSFQQMSRAVASLMPTSRAANEPLMELVKTAEILAASNPMQGLEGAAFSLREAVSGDFVSIVERFNLPRSYLTKLKQDGVPAIEAVRRAMTQMGYDTSLVANMSKTLTGRWSTLTDTFDGFRLKVAQPIFDRLKAGLMGVQLSLDDNKTALDAWANVAGARLAGAIDALGASARNLGRTVDGLTRYFRENEVAQIALIGTLAALTAAWQAHNFAVGAGVVLNTGRIVAYTAAIAANSIALNGWMASLSRAGAGLIAVAGGPVTLSIAALAGLTAAVVVAYNKFEGFRAAVDRARETIFVLFPGVKSTADLFGQLGRAAEGVINPLIRAASATDDFGDSSRMTAAAIRELEQELQREHRALNAYARAKETIIGLNMADVEETQLLRGVISQTGLQIGVMANEMERLDQLSAIYGRDSEEVRRAMEAMSPAIASLRGQFGSLSEDQRRALAGLVGEYDRFGTSVEKAFTRGKTAIESMLGLVDARIAAVELKGLERQLTRVMGRRVPTTERGQEAYELRVLGLQRDILYRRNVISETGGMAPSPIAAATMGAPQVNINMGGVTVTNSADEKRLAQEIASATVAELVGASGRASGQANPALAGAR